MDKLKFTSEEELIIIQDGLNSQFWAVYSAWLSHASFTAIGSALSDKVENRDWMAGQANGLKRALNRPSERIRELKTKIEQAKKQNL